MAPKGFKWDIRSGKHGMNTAIVDNQKSDAFNLYDRIKGLYYTFKEDWSIRHTVLLTALTGMIPVLMMTPLWMIQGQTHSTWTIKLKECYTCLFIYDQSYANGAKISSRISNG